MKLRTHLLSLVLILALSTTAFGQAVSLSQVDGLNGTGGLDTGVPIVFHLNVSNNSGTSAAGITNGFQVYSDNGAEWTGTVAEWVNITDVMFDQLFINEFSLDGQGADTVGFAAFVLFKPGIPDGYDDEGFKVTIGPIDAAHNGKTVCLDSAWFPPSGIWKWAAVGSDIFPSWDGPHCYTVGEATLEITCPDNQVVQVCQPDTLCFPFSAPGAETVTATAPAYVDGNQVCVPVLASGVQTITLTASAGGDDADCSFNVDATVNQPPVVDGPGPSIVDACDFPATYCVDISVSDPDDDIQTVTTNDPRATIDDSGTPWQLCFEADASGSYAVIVTAVDACGNAARDTVTFTFEQQTAPVIDCPITYDNFGCEPGTMTIPVPIMPTDADVTVLPRGSWNPATGNLEFDATESEFITFTIIAANDCGADTCEFSTTVHLGPPVVECPGVVDLTICDFGEVCFQLPVGNISGPFVDASWTGSDFSVGGTSATLCFVADTEGAYQHTFTLGNQCEEITCDLTINVTQECNEQATHIEPDFITIPQAYTVFPNYAKIYVGNFSGGNGANDIDLGSVLINGVTVPDSAEVLLTYGDYTGPVLCLTVKYYPFIEPYMPVFDDEDHPYAVSGEFADQSGFSVDGSVRLVGLLAGDLDMDGIITISDLVKLVMYIFENEPTPSAWAGDLNRDSSVDISDVILMVEAVFGPQVVFDSSVMNNRR